MPSIVLTGGGDANAIGRADALEGEIGINVMAQLKASVLKIHGLEDGPEMEITAGAVGERNAGCVMRAAMVVTAFGPRSGAPGDVDDHIILTLLSPPPMMLQDSETEMQDRVGALKIAVDDNVDHALPLECAKMLLDIVFARTFVLFFRALLDDQLACVKPDGSASARRKGRAGEATCFSASQSGMAKRTNGQLVNHRNGL